MREILALDDTDSSVLVIRFLQKHHEEVSHIWIDLPAIGSDEVLM